ncbi:MAG: DUF1840 domain-containing protein [Zoogloeaceae bacterium]|nr:DUF1840 domain-containing protein [Zoogloeaceae bacterium]
MLITFKSAACADILMFGQAAGELLKLVGKDGEAATGIITVAQLPDAIVRLQAAIEADRARREGPPVDEEAAQESGQTGMAAPVSLAQRAFPLLSMMEESLKEDTPVTWGT